MFVKALIISIVSFLTVPKIIFNFTTTSNIAKWKTVNDGVMGGVSNSTFQLNSKGYGSFQGKVSLDNNGGFCSVRYRCGSLSVKNYTKIRIRLKGDGKKYQFRVKANYADYQSYIHPFHTNGFWQTIEINLKDMYPSFRGRRLALPNFSLDNIEEIRFLIANKKAEDFQLLIDNIELI